MRSYTGGIGRGSGVGDGSGVGGIGKGGSGAGFGGVGARHFAVLMVVSPPTSSLHRPATRSSTTCPCLPGGGTWMASPFGLSCVRLIVHGVCHESPAWHTLCRSSEEARMVVRWMCGER